MPRYILFCLSQSESAALIPIILRFSRTSFWASDFFIVSNYLGPVNLPVWFIIMIIFMGRCYWYHCQSLVQWRTGQRRVRPNGELDTEVSTGHRTIFRERNK